MEPADILQTIAEIAMGLAGFGGIAAGLGYRARGEWRSDDQMRLIGMACTSLLVVFAGLNVRAQIMLIDGSKVDYKMSEIFKSVKTFDQALSRVNSGVVRTWDCDPAEATWRQAVDPDSVG